jgi:hypothetical protein
MLASALGVSSQHAVGSLLSFWDLNGDPRDIEKLIETGKDAVIISRSQVEMRFKIASGADAKAELLTELGFLEPIDADQYRIRGMSRYFEPIQKRRQARAAASIGGKASAEARKAKTGTAQPQKVVRDAVQESLERSVKRLGSATRSGLEATLEATVEAETEAPPNLEYRDHSTESLNVRTYVREELPPIVEKQVAPAFIEAPTAPTAEWSADDFWRWAQSRRQESGLLVERMPHPRQLSGWWSEARMRATAEGLRAAFNAFGQDKHWEKSRPPYPFTGFIAQWDRFVPVGGANATRT